MDNEQNQARAIIDENVSAIINEASVNPLLTEAAPAATFDNLEPKINHEAEAAELYDFAYDALTPLYPSLTQVYTPEIRAKLSERTGKLMLKYNLTTGGMLEKWGAEIGFIIVVIPLIGKTTEAIKSDNAKRALANGDKPAAPKVDNSQAMQPVIDEVDENALHLRA